MNRPRSRANRLLPEATEATTRLNTNGIQDRIVAAGGARSPDGARYGFRTNSPRILGCVPMPMGIDLDHLVPPASLFGLWGHPSFTVLGHVRQEHLVILWK